MARDADEADRKPAPSPTGDPTPPDALLPLVYDELHRLARRILHADRAPTLQPTALIHEAYLRLARGDGVVVNDRLHFVRIAARAMRHVIADHARARHAQRRGGGRQRVTLDAEAVADGRRVEELIAVDDALRRLGEIDAQLAQIVELRFYGGLQNGEIAETTGMSLRSVERGWRVARAWLTDALSAEGNGG